MLGFHHSVAVAAVAVAGENGMLETRGKAVVCRREAIDSLHCMW